MIKLLEKMDEIENEIINSTKEFAAFNNIHFDELTKSMVLNAIRETKALHKHKRPLDDIILYRTTHQLCPKCFGEGQVFNTGATSSLYRTCPVCNGAKTLKVETCLPVCASGAVDKSKI